MLVANFPVDQRIQSTSPLRAFQRLEEGDRERLEKRFEIRGAARGLQVLSEAPVASFAQIAKQAAEGGMVEAVLAAEVVVDS